MEKPECANCQFFTKPAMNSTAYGECVRFPTPITHLETYWCGEYQPKGDLRIKEPSKAKR